MAVPSEARRATDGGEGGIGGLGPVVRTRAARAPSPLASSLRRTVRIPRRIAARFESRAAVPLWRASPATPRLPRASFARNLESGDGLQLAQRWPCHPKLEERRMAEREGFEPSVAFRLHVISNHAHSTTLPPLRVMSPALAKRGPATGRRRKKCPLGGRVNSGIENSHPFQRPKGNAPGRVVPRASPSCGVGRQDSRTLGQTTQSAPAAVMPR